MRKTENNRIPVQFRGRAGLRDCFITVKSLANRYRRLYIPAIPEIRPVPGIDAEGHRAGRESRRKRYVDLVEPTQTGRQARERDRAAVARPGGIDQRDID